MPAMAELLTKVLAGRLIGGALDRLQRFLPDQEHFQIWAETLFPGSLRLHRKRLAAKLRKMPFIYGDLERGDILSDFVDLEYREVSAKDTRLQPRLPFHIQIDERLKRKRKILIAGAAGIGKTTFVRHVILSLLGVVPPVPFFYRDENLLPFYVPLKAVDNSAPRPIVRYVLENEPLFRRRGIDLLSSLADENPNRVFLVLDGYDEVPFSKGLGHVHDELRALMAGELADMRLQQGTAMAKLYARLASSRVWLTSRPEFFEKHPLPLRPFSQKSGPDVSSLAVKITGLGNNTNLLVKSIFDKYRRMSSFYATKLSEGYFVGEMEALDDAELQEILGNPLFLTVLCFIYVTSVHRSQSHEVDLDRNVTTLVQDCVKLLLVDLDRQKVSDLQLAHQRSQRSERTAHAPQKERFLSFLAAELYLDNRNVFSYSYLAEKVIRYFSVEEPSEVGAEIIKGVRSRSRRTPNFVDQLIECGVFVLVDRGSRGDIYDFPHRRFREVQALAYFEKPGNVQKVTNLLTTRNVGELILLAFRQWPNSERAAVFRELLSISKQEDTGSSNGLLLLQVMDVAGGGFNPSAELQQFYEGCMSADKRFSLPRELLDRFEPNAGFLVRLSEEFRQAATASRLASLAIAAELLAKFDVGVLRSLFAQVFALEGISSAAKTILWKYRLRYDAVGSHDWFRTLPRGSWRDACLRCLALDGGSATDGKALGWLLRDLDSRETAVLYLMLQKCRPDIYSSWAKGAPLGANHDMVLAAIENRAAAKLAVDAAEKSGGEVWFYPHSLGATLRAKQSHRSAWSEAKGLFEALAALEKVEGRFFASLEELRAAVGDMTMPDLGPPVSVAAKTVLEVLLGLDAIEVGCDDRETLRDLFSAPIRPT